VTSLIAQTVGDAGALAELAPEWWELWRRAESATPFQSPAWLIAWWRHFHPGELFCVAVRDGTRLVALAPLYIEDGPQGRRVLPVGISISDYLDVLLDPAIEREAGAALVAHLTSRADAWDGWDLEELAPDAAALRLPRPDACDETSQGQTACPVLALPSAVEDLGTHIPARKLRKLRMARNRAERRGETIVRRVDGADAPVFLQTLFDLHDARWKSRGEDGLLGDARVRRFQEEALPALVAAGFVRLYAVAIGGSVVGGYYGFLHRARAYAYLGGFDPEFAYESPGTILVGHAIEEAVREGAGEFHFLRGREAYKYEWGAVDRWNQRRSFRRMVAYA
jgi:CelD/BcsL family acetyltransferase involved in cellulose biosynthesis